MWKQLTDSESPSQDQNENEINGDEEVASILNIPDEKEGAWISFRTLSAYVGPGFLMCIAYLDPGNLEADLQTGAYTGFQLLWVLLLAHIFGLLLQSLASRLGVVTGHHLAKVAHLNYSRPASLILWIMAEFAIIGSDIQEVLGSAIAIQILTGIPLWAGCLITALDTFTFLLIHAFGIRKLEAVFVLLVSIMTGSFLYTFSADPPSSTEVFSGFIPTIESRSTVTALALLGAVIMPHNLYLHSALVLSRRQRSWSKKKIQEAIKYFTIDSAIALGIAFLINLCVVGTFAVQFYSADCAGTSTATACLTGDSIDSDAESYGICANGLGKCQEIGLSHAGDSLEGSLGNIAKYVWAIGVLAAGQSSTMTGTYAGQFVMEGFIDLRITRWQRVFLTRIIALGPALLVTLVIHGSNAQDKLSQWLNVLQSVQLPFALIPLVHFSSSEKLMGEFKVGTYLSGLLWTLTLGIIAINLYTVLNFVINEDETKTFQTGSMEFLLVFVGLAYLAFCIYLAWENIQSLYALCRRSTKFRLRRTREEMSEGEVDHSRSNSIMNRSLQVPLVSIPKNSSA